MNCFVKLLSMLIGEKIIFFDIFLITKKQEYIHNIKLS